MWLLNKLDVSSEFVHTVNTFSENNSNFKKFRFLKKNIKL